MIVWPDRFCQLLSDEGYFVIRYDNRDIGLSTKFSDHGVPRIVKPLLANWFGIKIEAPYDLYHMAQDAIWYRSSRAAESAHRWRIDGQDDCANYCGRLSREDSQFNLNYVVFR